ncbi:MAG: iron-containing alcohol dehydrogenase [Alphaproteobacteria bacterium]|nr:iron-containing alcohol dehydrogenase [Alphaproteobacteria bacterium]
MQNFTYQNAVKIVFGKDSIAQLPELLPQNLKIMITYGGGSIKKNGVYDQVVKALKGFDFVEFGGIEANPQFETCMKAVEIIKKENVSFLLAVGGGSVLDGTKFIAAAVEYKGDAWDIPTGKVTVETALPLASIMTLPATGSEMNGNSVISRKEIGEKRAFASEFVYPKFSILDPVTTFSLPKRQTVNGIVDTFVHVCEQYMTYDVNTPLQDRQAEAILHTVIEEAPKVLKDPNDYDARANIMWSATHGLNLAISCGVVMDWSTHMIGHELTAAFGLDHGKSLAVIMPSVFRYKADKKGDKLVQYANRIWGITEGSKEEIIEKAVVKTVEFFESIGMKTKLSDYGIEVKDCKNIPAVFEKRGVVLGEHSDIKPQDVDKIIAMSA